MMITLGYHMGHTRSKSQGPRRTNDGEDSEDIVGTKHVITDDGTCKQVSPRKFAKSIFPGVAVKCGFSWVFHIICYFTCSLAGTSYVGSCSSFIYIYIYACWIHNAINHPTTIDHPEIQLFEVLLGIIPSFCFKARCGNGVLWVATHDEVNHRNGVVCLITLGSWRELTRYINTNDICMYILDTYIYKYIYTHTYQQYRTRRWQKFQQRKPIGEVGCRESRMAERSH